MEGGERTTPTAWIYRDRLEGVEAEPLPAVSGERPLGSPGGFAGALQEAFPEIAPSTTTASQERVEDHLCTRVVVS